MPTAHSIVIDPIQHPKLEERHDHDDGKEDEGSGCTVAEAIELKGLVEDVDFSNAASYREKLETLKESYFPSTTPTTLTEEDTFDDVETGHAQDIDTSDSMAAYMSAIGRTANSAK